MIKKIFILTVPTISLTFILLELIFHFLIASSELPSVVYDKDYRLIKYKENQTGIYSIGKFPLKGYEWKINNEGWNNKNDYFEEKNKFRVAVIGDSYIEAFQVNVDEHYPSLVQSSLPELEIYSFGISGAPLSTYYQIAKYVSQKFNPDLFIINVVNNDYDESLYILRKRDVFTTLQNEESPKFITPSGLNQKWLTNLMNMSSTFRYFYHNLQLFHKIKSIIFEKIILKNHDIIKNNLRDKVKESMAVIVDSIYNISSKKILFVIDADRHEIYHNYALIENLEVNFYRKDFLDVLDKKSIEYIDLNDTFKDDYIKHSKQFNSNLDYHWDSYGHSIVAKEIISNLKNKLNYERNISISSYK